MSEVKVNKISPRSGTGVTLGDSGDTFTVPSGGAITIASGATITNSGTAVNFGATGSASWNTTVKTGDFTAVAGEGYFVNTTSGAINVTLPAGTAGAVVAIKDYAKTFDTNAVTLVRNGSDKIGGSAINATLSEEGIAVTLVFVDSTQGWLVTDSGLQSEAPTAQYIVATGGTITTVDTNFKVHTFTGPGTFTVCSVGNCAGSNEISYMVVAGGGGAGATANPSTGDAGGGGGAGGYREGKTPQCTYTQSPIACTSGSNNGLSVTATGYPVTVGAGGGGGSIGASGSQGSSSIFAGSTTITSAGGGNGRHNGGSPSDANRRGGPGGSGGGPSGGSTGINAGPGNDPPTSPAQGNDGSLHAGSPDNYGGAGGGAGAAGVDTPGNAGAAGGAATPTSINGTATTFAGGGGGGGAPPGPGGQGGGQPSTPLRGGGGPGGNAGGAGNAGTANTGGGGGGGGGTGGPAGASGGSGIVIIRYKFQ